MSIFKNYRIYINIIFLVFVGMISVLAFQETGKSGSKAHFRRERAAKLIDIPIKDINLVNFHEFITYLYDSGELDRELSKITDAAKEYIDRNIDKCADNCAVVFDLDETLLSNYRNIKKMKFALDWEKMNYDSCTLINPTYELYKYVIEKNLKVIFITARGEKVRRNTVDNLNRLGISKWDTLFLAPLDFVFSNDNSIKYKTAARKSMIEKGYRIIFSIGDKNTDLVGGFADTTFKLINVLY